MQAKSRPTGVTIIAILNIIGGIIMLLAGIGLVVAGAIIPMLPASIFEQPGNLTAGDVDLSQVPPAVIGGAGIGIGGVLIAIAIFSFVVAYGLLKGASWAWTLSVVLSIISIVLNAVSIATGNVGGIINVIISGIILYYLYRPHVKAFFGKGVSPTTASTV